ncbi:PulJ/GspJ family protein [Candidatus Magnetominusculus xianensis]|uniref:Type II secretory pathway, component PulJ n=1 Tax=Candidatus Magnetominusculus xianensis TaxID=1748249 RepID=A0ABR5SIE1_9BACT|nr:prepilin-type N-terminal cleavage/methylation domain-containing protein [Candidatus Magnetominusculus xianensis]KWT90990.1 type II secretory pathway, component PulJ [Candidatus Magnetominusculus xianensis]MBF0403144.1 prepilin-type N-terminal cleavage/methylation domain-containing protein [Nitrospirota bacterium]
MTSRRGFTLIEVVVATAIFTSMVLLSTAALNQGFKQYKTVMEEGVNLWRVARSFWIHKSAAGMLFYYIDEGKRREWYPYYVCNSDVISYVSASPMADNVPVVAWIVREKHEDNYNVVYYELPVYVKKQEELEKDYQSGNYKKGNSFVIIENVNDVRFESYVEEPLTKLWDWSREYYGKVGGKLPKYIRIAYKKDGRLNALLLSVATNATIYQNPNMI